MYQPPAFREDRAPVLHAAMRAHPLATLVSVGAEGITANVVPFTLVTAPSGDVLHAHLARANAQLDDLRNGSPVLVVFHGPHAYVSPSWYATKHTHGKVVPTWNYVVVQARGTPRVIDDAAWLRTQIDALTATHEAGRDHPWTTSDAPADFVQAQLKGIVGVEIPIDRLEGKWKVSQNRSREDRAGVAAGLRDDGHHAAAALVPTH